MNSNSLSASDSIVRGFRIALAGLVLVAIVYQLSSSPSWLNFFSFFTIQSNVIGAAVFLIGAIFLPRPSRSWDLIRGGSTMYLMLTGIIYNTILSRLDADLQLTASWVNIVLHTVMPIAIVLDLVLIPMAHHISWREGLTWVIYPLAYFAYALIRGHFADWYPYPFLDPREDGGYPQVAMFSAVVFIAFLAAIWLVTTFTHWRTRSSTDSMAASRLNAVPEDGKIE